MKTIVLTLLCVFGVSISSCGGDVEQSGQGGVTGGGGNGSSSAAVGAGGDASSTVTGGMTGAGGSGGGCGFCDFACCGAACTNVMNDIKNCGACGVECPGPAPYCDSGKCGAPPCDGQVCGPGPLVCCGANCCAAGELCCDVPGPIGSVIGCFMPTAEGTCPKGCTSCKCAAPDTPIATPGGERPIASLHEGDLVYSVDHGAIVAVPIQRTQRVPVKDHRAMRIDFAGGRSLLISGGHPTADGRSFSDLRAGSVLDGARVEDAQSIAYPFDATYDILPMSETGFYFAAGALIGSTMAPPLAASLGAPRAAP